MREVVVHLNVGVPEADERDADQIGAAIMSALEVGRDDDSVRDLDVVVALAEEVG